MPNDNQMTMGPLGTAAVGTGMGIVNNVSDLVFGKMKMKQQLEGQKKALEQQNAAQMDMWNKTNYGAQMKHLKDAGLNAGLLYGMSGGGGVTAGSGSASVTPQGGHGMDIMGAAQLALLNAQRENIEADTENKRGDTVKPGVKTANLEADTQNKILTGIIQKYAGQEAGRQWDINKELTTQEYGAKADELDARMAQATNIIRMYEDGTMKKMSDAELEQKLKDIGLKDVNIKGKELENALSEMEVQLMKDLGMGRDAKGWIDTATKLVTFLIGKFVKGGGGK